MHPTRKHAPVTPINVKQTNHCLHLSVKLKPHLDAAELALELVGDIIIRRRGGARVSPHIKGLVQRNAAAQRLLDTLLANLRSVHV